MPTNLTPEYYKTEERFRAATTNEEKISLLEDMLSLIPKHKGTDHLRADLRRKLSKLKIAPGGKSKTSRHASIFHIDPEGAGQIAVLGPANTGKSALVDALTNAEPEVAEYPFTTRKPTPGMMAIENIQVQLIDTPPLDREVVEPELIDLIRRVDLVLLIVDLQAFPIEQVEQTVAFLEGHRIIPASRRDSYPQDLRWSFPPFIIVVNKADGPELDQDYQAFCDLLGGEWTTIPISVASERGIDSMKQAIFDKLELIRVYSKAPGREPDHQSPFVMNRGGTVEEFAAKIHQDFSKNLKVARVWGSGDFEGQMVSRDYELHDGDIVELRM
jgi:hypothetical protein